MSYKKILFAGLLLLGIALALAACGGATGQHPVRNAQWLNPAPPQPLALTVPHRNPAPSPWWQMCPMKKPG